METTVALPETRRERRVRQRVEKKIKVGAVECTLADLIFPVELIANPDKTNKEYSRVVVGMVNGEKMSLNYCSNIYQLVPNEAIFPEIEKVLDDNNILYEKSYSHIDHVKFFVEYKITDPRFAYRMKGTNDNIVPLIRVQHSYNGLIKYRIIFGYFRFICENGLVIAVEELKKYNLVITGKHTKVILNSFKLLNKMLKNFTKNADTMIADITSKYEILGGRWIKNPEDRITEVLKANKIAIHDNSKASTMNFIMTKLRTEADHAELGYNGHVNDWLIYNAINQYLYKNGNIMTPTVRMEKDSKIFEYMLKYQPA